MVRCSRLARQWLDAARASREVTPRSFGQGLLSQALMLL